VLGSGAAVAQNAGHIAGATGISESLMGGLFTASATPLPELVTPIAAVRLGALTLAVSDIVMAITLLM
jgi:cation:H+ antiporter